ncbi:FAD-dependent oxidoreductase [Curtobacterium flaccumfaciens]|uniref:FAD-dependent oxidoreductase n=1 Tax=Curtobacterium flaccumfaciens TaxID=2035 RepID=UPI000FFE8218|nr:FAD-dependent oxidoreductase [Curtobacterium flaccumfaciens]MCS0645185.1 FAD-dependent oxidoreductase [Curtobacterium flaccumfaciens pv. flaccumfaciens]MCS6527199.1 FAD-dependent oxidoreductase [Curtobacterium flaccumfaciens pv. flaccumfaciens]MCS6531092.1 FAD-dependent oxidoreductase [Curtobacterium flaccumfaciens pv. flaccumfaciens]NUU09154.1 FAD-dependent oxidoreductase [Curtobacterium flaccumfaciens]RXF82853.1 FAD-dependent oxidoreductase [Curtobacterium flaccumfaciens pv. flaccumfacien
MSSSSGSPEHTAPVVVIGAGVVGAATAYALTARGERVLLVEQHARGHHLGSSHGATRIFRQGYADPEYVALTTRALALWEALEAAAGEELIVRTGAVDHGRPEVVDAIAAALADADIPHESLTPEQAAARWPGIAFEGNVLTHPSAGRIRSDRTIEVFLTLAEGTGLADLRFDTRVTGLEDHGDAVTVTLSDGSAVRTASVVAAVGSWAPTLVGGLLAGRGAGLPAIRVTQEQPAHFPSHLPDAAWPSFVHWADGDDVYGLLTPGEGVKVGFHGTGPVVDPDHRDFVPVPAEAERLQAYVARYVPGVDATKPEFISCLYDNSPDEDFVIDRVGPLTVATGFSGHGFKFAPLLGEMLADLATGGVPHPRFALPDPAPAS